MLDVRSLIGNRKLLAASALAALLIVPVFLTPFWLFILILTTIAAIGAIGLNLLYGGAGQLSIGHSFFIGIGAFAYAFASGSPSGRAEGLELPPLVGILVAIAASGFAGLLFSPVSARLKALALAVATFGLVFLGEHIFPIAARFTGGVNGRSVERFSIGPWEADTPLSLWYVVLVFGLFSAYAAYRLMNSQVGLGLNAIRDGQIFAGALGVHVLDYKAKVFIVSSMYAGLSGALLGVATGFLVPESFGFMLAINMLLMVVIGGTGRVVSGSIVGAAVVTVVPEALRRYSGLIPFISQDPLAAMSPQAVARYSYGFAIIILLVTRPKGLAEVFRLRT